MLTVVHEPCSSLQNIVPPATIWQAPQLHSRVEWRKDPRPVTQRAVSVISDNFTCKILSHHCKKPHWTAQVSLIKHMVKVVALEKSPFVALENQATHLTDSDSLTRQKSPCRDSTNATKVALVEVLTRQKSR